MAFWAHTTKGSNVAGTAVPDGVEEEEEVAERSGALVAQRQGASPQAPPSQDAAPQSVQEQKRARAIAQGRKAHSGKFTFDIRYPIVLGVLGIVVVAMYLVYRNIAKARAVIHEQIAAKQTAMTLAMQLAPLVPNDNSSQVGTATGSNTQLEAPALTVTSASHAALYDALAAIDAMRVMPDGSHVDVWVIDARGWVYADSREPRRAVHTSTGARPNFNLHELALAQPSGDAVGPSSHATVASAIVTAARHGAGLVDFQIPTQGISGSSVTSVSLYVQPIPNTKFLVATKVGKATKPRIRESFVPPHDAASVRPVPAPAPAPAPASAPASAPAPAPAPAPSASAALFEQLSRRIQGTLA